MQYLGVYYIVLVNTDWFYEFVPYQLQFMKEFISVNFNYMYVILFTILSVFIVLTAVTSLQTEESPTQSLPRVGQ